MSSKDKKGVKVEPKSQGGGLSQNISDKLRKKREERNSRIILTSKNDS